MIGRRAHPRDMTAEPVHVVVGIDDSGTARQALRWAVEEAAALGVELDVIHVYSVPVVLTPPPLIPPTSARDDHEQKAKELLARLTAEALAGAAKRSPAVEQIAVEGVQPGRVLVTCSKANDVLVVGSRGRGAMASALLGSASHYCVHHAPCRVVVIPSGAQT